MLLWKHSWLDASEQQLMLPWACAVFTCRKLGIQKLVGMGGFRNQRDVFKWEGETLELDETSYEWGTLYEIEVETVSAL